MLQKPVSQASGCLHRIIPSGSAMHDLGQALARALQQATQTIQAVQVQQKEQPYHHTAGWVVYLSGQLGAGKTRLCQGLLAGLGYQGAVKSPTYTLVESYAVACASVVRNVHHFDFYRIGDPEELELFGIRDYFTTDSLCLMEWPERVPGFLPTADLMIHIAIDQEQPEQRRLYLEVKSYAAGLWLQHLP